MHNEVAQAPSTAKAVPLPLGGRLFATPIITQIGRENKFSADVFVPAISPLRTTEKKVSVLFSCLIKFVFVVEEFTNFHYDKRSDDKSKAYEIEPYLIKNNNVKGSSDWSEKHESYEKR